MEQVQHKKCVSAVQASFFFFQTSWSKASLLSPPRGRSNNWILAPSFQQQPNADVSVQIQPEWAAFWCSYVNKKKSAFLWHYTGYCVSKLGHHELQDGSRFRAWTPGAEWQRTSPILLMGWPTPAMWWRVLSILKRTDVNTAEHICSRLQRVSVPLVRPWIEINQLIPQSLPTLIVLQASFIYSFIYIYIYI